MEWLGGLLRNEEKKSVTFQVQVGQYTANKPQKNKHSLLSQDASHYKDTILTSLLAWWTNKHPVTNHELWPPQPSWKVLGKQCCYPWWEIFLHTSSTNQWVPCFANTAQAFPISAWHITGIVRQGTFVFPWHISTHYDVNWHQWRGRHKADALTIFKQATWKLLLRLMRVKPLE